MIYVLIEAEYNRNSHFYLNRIDTPKSRLTDVNRETNV